MHRILCTLLSPGQRASALLLFRNPAYPVNPVRNIPPYFLHGGPRIHMRGGVATENAEDAEAGHIVQGRGSYFQPNSL